VNGTLNVLRAAAKAGTVKRVVVTSSVAAVVGETLVEGKAYSEADWNLDSRLGTLLFFFFLLYSSFETRSESLQIQQENG